MNFLNRLWTGFVAAIAAVAIALAVHIIGTMVVGLPIEFLQWMILGFGTVGFLVGIALGNRGRARTPESPNNGNDRDIWLE